MIWLPSGDSGYVVGCVINRLYFIALQDRKEEDVILENYFNSYIFVLLFSRAALCYCVHATRQVCCPAAKTSGKKNYTTEKFVGYIYAN